MFRLLFAVAISIYSCAGGERLFEISGAIEPKVDASISIFGTDAPFAQATLADRSGHFHFGRLRTGTYTVSAMAPGEGEARMTVEAGPQTADARGRITVRIRIPSAEKTDLERRHSIAAPELAIPERAWREYREAQRSLARRDSEAAREHLERSVEIAPGFSEAWNNLGTIAYQTGRFERAATCFEKALAANPRAYEPLVNMGGVLINLGRFEEAREYNQHAVLLRPNDALGNSQLGITWFELGKDGEAEKYLRRACELDRAHFSHPQLVLAQLHIRQNRKADAAADLEEFLRVHPDAPNAAELRGDIVALRH